MVTAGGEDPNPNLGRGRRGPACPPPIPAPGFFGMPPQTPPELDLPFPTRLSAHEVGAIDWRLSPCAKLPKARRGGSGGPGSWSVSSSPNPQSCLPLEGKAGIPTPPPQCPPPPPYTYTHLRGPAHSLPPARAFQSQDPAPTASEAPKPCNQPAPRSGRPGTKGERGGNRAAFLLALLSQHRPLAPWHLKCPPRTSFQLVVGGGTETAGAVRVARDRKGS